jgi:ankyrin repeat protein
MDNTTVKELDLDFNNDKLVEDIKQQCYSNKAYIQLYEQQGFALINMALLMNELEFADWLVDNGAEVNTTNDGGTPLSCACFKGNAKLIKKIAAKTSKEYVSKSGAVGQAIYSGKKGNVQAVLDLGFSVNEPDNYGSTPLYTAISAVEALESEFREPGVTLKKELKLVEFLLEKGAVLGPKELQSLKYWDELRGKNEENILFYCFNYQMYDLLKLLIENGIDVNEK